MDFSWAENCYLSVVSVPVDALTEKAFVDPFLYHLCQERG